MSAEKLSISLDSDLAASVRAAAAEDDVTVSTWLAEAAEDKARRRALRDALDDFERENGQLTDDDVERLMAEAHRNSILTRAYRGTP